MKKLILALLMTPALWAPLQACAAASHHRIPALEHVFLIMMENHDYDKDGRVPAILGNPDAPFINAMARRYDLATRYLAVGHPSLTNYLELVGGSNFGINKDHFPNWGSTRTTDSRYGLIPAHGTDIASDSFAGSKACCDEKLGYTVPGGARFTGKTIADQLAEAGKAWRSYQESLPMTGGYGVNRSDGSQINRGAYRYAAKHNPFEYFKSTQGAKSIRSFSSDPGTRAIGGTLARDLASGDVGNLNFIAPNLCHDMHGSSECPNAHRLIRDGDEEVAALVGAITRAPIWKRGKNAIIVMWDENDFSATDNNRIPVIIRTNYQSGGLHSSRAYNHFSLLKSMEQGFGLSYLNHANDSQIHAMTDIFAPR